MTKKYDIKILHMWFNLYLFSILSILHVCAVIYGEDILETSVFRILDKKNHSNHLTHVLRSIQWYFTQIYLRVRYSVHVIVKFVQYSIQTIQ